MKEFNGRSLELLEPLSRLIPVKPTPSDVVLQPPRLFRCPNCHNIVTSSYFFCCHCGQALDWSYVSEEIYLTLSVPCDQIDEVRRYATQGGEAPSCVAPLAIASAIERAVREVSVNE